MLDEKDLQEIAHLMTVLIENEVTPKFDLFSEGRQSLLAKMEELTPKSRVGEPEDDVALPKQALRFVTRQLNDPKKAQ